MIKSKPEILIIDNSPDITGAFKSIKAFTDYLSDEFDFIYCIDKNSRTKTILKKNQYSIFTLSLFEIKKSLSILIYFPLLIINSIRLFGFIQKKRISVVHINDMYNMIGILLKMYKPALHIIYHIRLLPDSYVSRLYKTWAYLINKYADRIICVSETVRAKFPYSKLKTEILYDTLRIDDIQPIIRDGKKEVILLYVANYIKGKGHEYAIEAFKKALQNVQFIKLKFVGGDLNKRKNQKYKRYLESLVYKYNLKEKIIFENKKENLSDEYKQADILLNFSESESFSMTCLEGLAHGLPVISSRSGGPEEIIDDKTNGILVPNKDVKSMISAITQLALDHNLRKKLSVNGPLKVHEKFSIHQLSGNLKKIYLNAY